MPTIPDRKRAVKMIEKAMEIKRIFEQNMKPQPPPQQRRVVRRGVRGR